MATTYTPPVSPVFTIFPVTLITDGDPGIATTWNGAYQTIFDSLQRLKLDTDNDIGKFAALLIKLGITVLSPGDVALPTYSSGNILSAGQTHHSALESLDTGIATQTTRIDNVDANVGGSVASAGSPVYASGNVVFVSGDSHHTALEKLDDYAAINRTLATTASTDSASSLSSVTNVIAKLGTGAGLAPAFDWTYEKLISDGQTVKTIIDNFDRYVFANRRLADQTFGNMVKLFKKAMVGDFSFYDTFIDATKIDGSSTTSPDTFLYEVANASGLDVIWVKALPAVHSTVAMLFDFFGTVSFKANLIGSLAPVDFVTITSESTFFTPTSPGSSLVVKATLTGSSSKLYNIAAVTKI